ncbi:MAG: hypothetical protein DI628_06185 [Blastochloris viridis]|uniref:Pyrrolo-quinoline quinone repeat domain-containing protein n=1 Tax=Blastochloris viridis TaxID=1079 RepID=A0A6N4QYB7_BLAVI|nr:MAG: hypothetical protein DI628_06185 [Blastochloris viridis]
MRAVPFSSLAIAAALLLAGCSVFKDEEKVKLSGERIDVTLQPTLLQADPVAAKEPFDIPSAQPLENWAMRGGNAAHAPGHVELPAQVKRAWTYKLGGKVGRGEALLNPPIVHSGRVFAVNTKGEVTALDAKTGKRLWEVELPFKKGSEAKVTGGLAVMGNLLFATTGDGQVFALTASDGKQAWQVDLAVPLRAAPTVEGERVFVTSHDNRLFALNALDGALVWTHSGMEEVLNLLASPAPAAGNGAVVVPYSSGEVYVLRASDGRYIWHDSLTSSFSGQDPESTVSAIAAPPVIADGLVYVVGLNGGLSAYGLANGQRFWRVDVLTSQMPIVAGMQMFALTEKGEMVGVNRRDGSIRWVSDLAAGLPESEGQRYWSGPVLAGGRLVATSSDGYAVSIKPETGEKIAQTNLDEPVTLPPVVADGGLYFLTDSGRIIAFR